MLLLDIDCGGEQLVQGFVRVGWPSGDRIAAGQVAGWASFFVRSALLWSQVQPLSAAVRVAARPGLPLTSVHCLVVPKPQEARLRLVLAAFLRTAGMADADSDVPHEHADLAGNFTHCDDARLALGYERLRTGSGLGLHYNLRLADRLPRLVQTLADLGVPVAWEAQVTPWSPPRDLLRPILYDAARIDESRAAPRELVLDQHALAERLKRVALQRPSYHVEECLAAPADVLDAVRETAANLLSETIYGAFGAAPQLVPVPPPQAEAFGYHVHSRLMLGPPEPVDAESVVVAAAKDEADRLLCCGSLLPGDPSMSAREPPGGSLFLNLTGPPMAPSGSGPGSARAAAAGASGERPYNASGERPSNASGERPSNASGERPYLFVSYARQDGDMVYPLIDELQRSRVSTWIDRHIVGGEDWVSELETRLIRCVGVLALISPSFVASRYCTREVNFADALNRPIVPVAIAPGLQLGHGLQFLLTNVQIINFYESRSVGAILDAVDRHARAARSAG